MVVDVVQMLFIFSAVYSLYAKKKTIYGKLSLRIVSTVTEVSIMRSQSLAAGPMCQLCVKYKQLLCCLVTMPHEAALSTL
jgi:hypothetical protein